MKNINLIVHDIRNGKHLTAKQILEIKDTCTKEEIMLIFETMNVMLEYYLEYCETNLSEHKK